MSCVVMTTNCGWTNGGPQNISLVTHAHFDGTTFCPLLTVVVVVLIGHCLLFSSINYYLYRMWANSGFVTAVVGGR